VALAAFKILKSRGLASKMLVIAPKRAVQVTWPDEIAKWSNFSDLTYTVLHGEDKNSALHKQSDIYLINPDGLKWFYDPAYGRWKKHKFDILCIDESTDFKNYSTRRFKLLKAHLPDFHRRWILTGSPRPKAFEDLFSQVYILDLGRALGRFITHFRKEFLYADEYKPFTWYVRPGMFDVAMDRIAPLVYQLNAEDHLKMPELIPVEVPVVLPPAARKIYNEVEDEFITVLQAGTLVANNAAAAGTKCRQIANGAVYLEDGSWELIHDAKIEALTSLVDALKGTPLLVLYEFAHDQERLQKAFPEATTLTAGMEGEPLRKLVADFNAGKIPILLGHPQTTGISLNLQGACHHVIWFGITWNLLYYDQTIGRVWRQGQKEDTVMVYHIVAKDTRDEKVVKVLEEKDRDQQAVLDALASYRK